MMLFTNNATINKVKAAYQPWYPKTNNSPKKAYMNDGGLSLWTWDTDSGIRLTNCPPYGWFEHLRVYAPPSTDRMYNTYYGYWILASTHFDGNDGCDNPAFGYSETAQGWFVQNARTIWRAAAVSENCCWMFNEEPLRYEGNHIWESNGYASYRVRWHSMTRPRSTTRSCCRLLDGRRLARRPEACHFRSVRDTNGRM